MIIIYIIMNQRGINKYVIQELAEKLFGQICIFYTPSKSNKKMIQKLFESIPFFFFDMKCQNMLYEIIKKHQVSNYMDKNDDLRKFCYIIYEELSKRLKIPFKTYHEFIDTTNFELYSDTIKMKKTKLNINHTYLFMATIFSLTVFYIYIKNKS
jgi:hypothetical protein